MIYPFFLNSFTTPPIVASSPLSISSICFSKYNILAISSISFISDIIVDSSVFLNNPLPVKLDIDIPC